MAMNIGISQTGGWNIGVSQGSTITIRSPFPCFRPNAFIFIMGMLISILWV